MNHDDQAVPRRDPLLASPFDALRSAMAEQDAPRGVEKELMAAFAKQFPKKRWYQRLTRGQWGKAGGLGGALAAALAVVVTLHTPAGQGGAERIAVDERGDFIALASPERIEQEAHPHMLETEMPRYELAALGVPVSPENANESIRAEMLVGADGAALAVRLSVN